MSVNKLLILAAAGVVSTAALAGGSNYKGSSAPSMNTHEGGMYVGVRVGYDRNPWEKNLGSTGITWKDGNGGFAFGGEVGYQFDRYLALELGGYRYADQTMTVSGVSAKTKPWTAYLALRLSVPVYQDVDLFAKFGLGYVREDAKVSANSDTSSDKETIWAPMFGAGANYMFADNWTASLNWDHFSGETTDGKVKVVNSDVITLGVEYMFDM